MLFTPLITYIKELVQRVEEPQTYGSALEAYIVSKNPQSTYDVEYWTRQFDERVSNRSTAGWPL